MSDSALQTTDVLVIGGGLAGERCAIEAAAAGQDVLILSLVPPRRSHSCAAQGGMQAALGNCAESEGDKPTLHFLDTVRGSDWGADQEVAQIFAEEAPVAVRELAHFGRAVDTGSRRAQQLLHQGQARRNRRAGGE